MFPFDPWRRWVPKIPAPAWRDFEFVLAAYRLAFAGYLFLTGLGFLALLPFLVWAAARDEEVGAGLLISGAVGLPLLVYQWFMWRFLQKSWSVIRAHQIARLAEHSESVAREIDP